MSINDIMAKERQAVEEALIKGNLDALDEFFASDAVFHTYPFPDYKGLDNFKQSLRDATNAYQFIGIDWEEVICEGNTAVQRYIFKMKHIGTIPKLQIPPTGKEVVLNGCAVYHVKNGKIVEFINYEDHLGFLQQLGVAPSVGQNDE